MDRQCSSCGGFCKKSGCERENVKLEPEPVAWMYEYGTDHGDAVNQIFWHKNLRLEKPTGLVRNVVPLYTAPSQREWQGLADEERNFLAWESNNGWHCVAMTEAKLKEKNS